MQKSYLYWPYLQQLNTTVTNCFKEEDAFYVECEETIFYPHLAGGQPEDIGKINDIDVLHVREIDGRIQHQVAEEIELGPVEIEIDWDRRYDHMQQHTAQHIISGIFDQVYGIQTVGFMIGEKTSTIDFDCLDRHNAKKVAEDVIALSNALIQAGVPVHRSFETNLTEEQKEKAKGAPLRSILIPTLPKNECGGTHVANTAEVQYIRMVKWQKDRDHYRMTYIAGKRCISEYERLLAYALTWAEEDGTGTMEVLDQIDASRRQKNEEIAQQKKSQEYVKEAIQEKILLHKKNVKGYTLLTDFLPAGYKLQDIAKGLSYDLLFFMNDEGQFYFEGKNQVPAIRKWMDDIIADPTWKGGGRDGTLNGRFNVDDVKEKYDELLVSLTE